MKRARPASAEVRSGEWRTWRPWHQRRGRPMSLRARMVLMQLGIVIAVVALVSVAFAAVLSRVVERQYAERVMGIAETVAQNQTIRDAFDDPYPPATIQPVAESIRTATGVSFVVVWNKDRIRYSHPEPERIGQELSTDNTPALDGQAYTAVERGTLGVSVRAKVPIYRNGVLIGGVSVGVLEDQVQGLLLSYWPQLAGAVLAALVVGAICSHALARHIKRQIYGLEPSEIVSLLQQREALLNGIREGVLAIDRLGIVTVANAEARRLLDLPVDVEGRHILEAVPGSELPDVIRSGQPVRDRLTLGYNGRPIVVNRMPVRLGGQVIGAISTFRDQSEVQHLARELTGTRSHLDALRAQAHEFANKLHTIAGLLELGWQDQAIALITKTTRDHQSLVDELPRRIEDPAVAALLLGKASVAAERGISFEVKRRSHLAADPLRSADLVTIAGNLIDNAFDATEGRSQRWVRVSFSDRGGALRIAVRDSGSGIAEAVRDRLFEHGVTTKPPRPGVGPRGVGLTLVYQVVTQLGGTLSALSSATGGALFMVQLPLNPAGDSAALAAPDGRVASTPELALAG